MIDFDGAHVITHSVNDRSKSLEEYMWWLYRSGQELLGKRSKW